MKVKRVIPCLDIYQGKVVKGINFAGLKDINKPYELAMFYSNAGADELVFLNVFASADKKRAFLLSIEEIAKKITVPFTVGGGISSDSDIKDMLNAGASKVSISSAAVKNNELISRSAALFGGSKIMVAIDAKKNQRGGYDVYINGGKTNTGLDAVKWAKKVENLGAGEILLTSIDADGTKNGYDIPLTAAVSQTVDIPVIASGGAGQLKHFSSAVLEGKADAVLAASLFHYGIFSVMDVKRHFLENGIPVNMPD